MEAIHDPKNRGWISEELFNVGEFLRKWQISLIQDLSKDKASKHDLYRVKYECIRDFLKCPFQDRVEYQNDIEVPKFIRLRTLKIQKDRLYKRRRYANDKQANTKSDSKNFPPPKIHKIEVKDEKISKFMPIAEPDVILTVEIHSPERRLDPKVISYMKMPAFHVEQELNVLGCQFLTELRERIDCISDNASPGDYSEHPHVKPLVTYKDIYKSGFFYINGVFYNDMRDKDCRDYSEPIIKWSENRDLGPFKKARMEETRFTDLTIQLGYPYLYVHQGECEHLIIFSDMRLYSAPDDENNRNAYPVYSQVKPSKRIFCMVCHIHTAVWIVYGCKRVPENPYFFCKSCFFSFNYDENDQKIGDFKAYHYPDRTRLF